MANKNTRRRPPAAGGRRWLLPFMFFLLSFVPVLAVYYCLFAPLDIAPENLNVLVQESLAFLAPELNNRDILVETELRENLPPLPLDRHQIKQAFYNIIKNAAQAMKSGGILHIRTDRDENHISVTFKDSGGGIPMENMSKVFDPYFTTKEGGSGLGLLIVRRIVREHGGEIDIVNSQGRGLELTIRLPLHDRRLRMLSAGEENADLGVRNADFGNNP